MLDKRSHDHWIATEALRAPALFLIGISCFGILLSLFGLVAPDVDAEQFLPYRPGTVRYKLIDLNGIPAILITCFILYGAVQMRSAKNYSVCLAAAILACIPCTSPCCVFGIPIGIWALVILSQAKVRAGFRAS